MNERIKKLGMQAGLMTGEKEQLFFCRPIAQFDEYSPEIEKFAELIVQECAVLCRWEHEAHAMLEHFGVKP